MSPSRRPAAARASRLVQRLAAAVLLGCLAAAPALAADAPAGTTEPSAAVRGANELIAAGRLAEAVRLLEPWTKEHPEDQLAAQTLLGARVTLKEQEIRSLLAEQALLKGQIAGDPDYEAAKSRAELEVRRRLEIVEYYVAQRQYGDAAALCNAILHDYPHNEAALCLKFRVLDQLVAREREELLKDHRYRHDEGINDVIRDGAFWRDPPKIPRTMWIFDEDIEAAERAAVEAKLREKVTLIYDGNNNGTQSAQVREVLGPLFSYIGVNYVILDDALGSERLTIHLVDEPVGNALSTIAKMVNVRFNYSGGTVYVTNQDSEVMVTRIIRLRSGLTDVETEQQLGGMTGQSGQAGTAGGGGVNGMTPEQQQQLQQAQQLLNGQQGQNGQGGQQGQRAKSDLEKFLDKVPEIVVGWPQDAKMHLDRKSNTLYVRSTPSSIAELERLLAALDYNNVQVLIETRFIEVSEDAARELGLDWSAGGQRGPVSVGGPDLVGPGGAPNPAASGAGIVTTAAGIGGPVPPVNGLFAQVLYNRGVSIAAKLTALEQEGKADTLSEPKILALNNSVGMIEVTQNIPYIVTYNSTTTSQTSQVSNGTVIPTSTTALVPQLDEIKTGITMRIRPSIARNSDVITLAVAPKVTELIEIKEFPFQYPSGTSTGNIAGSVSKPRVDERTLMATLHVQNGQTVALGGLTREREIKRMAGVPFFSRIPLLGQLFRRDSRQSERRNLIILVTAHIVDPNGSKMSDEVQRLRDTARVVLPEAVLEAEARAAAAADPNQRQGSEAPAAPRGQLDTPWSKGR